MNGNELFAQLIQRIRSYNDSCVLWILLKEYADEKEYAVSVYQLSDVQLAGDLKKDAVHRSLQRLQELGFITIRVRHKSETLIKVDREAVLNLLRTPIAERLPAVSKKVFPFLDAWNADLARRESGAQTDGDSGAIQDSDDSKLPE